MSNKDNTKSILTTDYRTRKIERVRNFSIIAHVDHGKSTLAISLINLASSTKKNTHKKEESVLYKLELEKERGITLKLNTIQFNYQNPVDDLNYTFNLIDTPGHVDFYNEVINSLSVCEGVIWLIDITKGIQAQTLAYFNIAVSLNLVIIPVINKIDISSEKLEEIKEQIISLLKIKEEEILLVSAKNKINLEYLLEAIIDRIPCPKI